MLQGTMKPGQNKIKGCVLPGWQYLEDKKPQTNPEILHYKIIKSSFFKHFYFFFITWPTVKWFVQLLLLPQVIPRFVSNTAALTVHHSIGSLLAHALAWVRKVDSLAPTFCQVLVPSEQRLSHLLMIHWKNWFYYFLWVWENFLTERSYSTWDDHPKEKNCQGSLP